MVKERFSILLYIVNEESYSVQICYNRFDCIFLLFLLYVLSIFVTPTCHTPHSSCACAPLTKNASKTSNGRVQISKALLYKHVINY